MNRNSTTEASETGLRSASPATKCSVARQIVHTGAVFQPDLAQDDFDFDAHPEPSSEELYQKISIGKVVMITAALAPRELLRLMLEVTLCLLLAA